MILRTLAFLFVALAFLASGAESAERFSLEYAWGDIPSCTSGRPNRVDNPIFTLANVPGGTAEIEFRLKDLDAPGYDHGGGSAAYTGGNEIEPGAFKYKSPCPPSGVHTYRWTATAKDDSGATLGKASATREYPE